MEYAPVAATLAWSCSLALRNRRPAADAVIAALAVAAALYLIIHR